MTTTPQPEIPQGPESQQPQVEQPQPSHGEQPQPPQPVYPQAPQGAYQQPQEPAYQQPAPGQAYPGQPVAAAQQVLDPAQQRQWGMLSHVIGAGAMIFSAGFLGFVGSLVVYLLYRERGDFVRRHAANSVNVQITMGILTVVGIVLCLTIVGLIVGIPLLIAAWIWALVVHIIGAMKANNGELYDPPLAYAFVK